MGSTEPYKYPFLESSQNSNIISFAYGYIGHVQVSAYYSPRDQLICSIRKREESNHNFFSLIISPVQRRVQMILHNSLLPSKL